MTQGGFKVPDQKQATWQVIKFSVLSTFLLWRTSNIRPLPCLNWKSKTLVPRSRAIFFITKPPKIQLYIYSHPQTDCSLVSQFFGESKPARCFKLGWKPEWLYVSRISYPRAIIILGVNEIIFLRISFNITWSATWSAQFLRRPFAYQRM